MKRSDRRTSNIILYGIILFFIIQVSVNWVRYPGSIYNLLSLPLLFFLIGILVYRDFFKNPLKRCPLCNKWLKSDDYKYVLKTADEALVLCKKCNRQYKIRKVDPLRKR